MPTIRSDRRFRGTTAISLAVISTLILVAPALAKSGGNAGGNAAASAACEDGGYVNWTDASGDGFRNAGACVSYAAHGGTLAPVVVPFSVSYSPSGASGFRATLTGTRLDPDSSVDLVVTWGGDPIFSNGTADASGDVTSVASFTCVMAGSPVTAVGATGTPAGGEFTEYALPLPDVCPPPA
jgi:hypothetical protein